MLADFVHRFVPGSKPVSLLLLHGTGGDENDLIPVARAVAPGAALLSPRGKVSEHGAPRFFARIAPGVFDETEIRNRADEFAEWLAEACPHYGIEPARFYALGYSNGANMATALMMLKPGVLAGGCLLRPMPLFRPDPLPSLHGAPILISCGQDDPTATPAYAEQLADIYAASGGRVDIAIQNAGHDLTPADFSLAKQWFAALLS